MLEPNPDRIVDATLQACPHCATSFPAGAQTLQQVHDRIDGRSDWRICCAARSSTVDSGDSAFSAAFKLLLLRALAIGRRREQLADTTRKRHAADLDRRLGRITAAVPVGADGVRLRKRILASRRHLFVFGSDRRVPATNTISERNLRPSVIVHKVTDGLRCEWGADTCAAFRSVVSTAIAQNTAVLDAVRDALATKTPAIPRVSNYQKTFDPRQVRIAETNA